MTKSAIQQIAPSPAPEDIRFAVLATDVVVFRVHDGRLQVLLRKVEGNPHFPDDWGIIGGLIRPTETAEESVDRHLRDKAGLSGVYKEQLETFSDVDRDPRGRVVSVAYIALIDDEAAEAALVKDGKTRWTYIRELPILAYDHNLIVLTAIQRLQARIFYTNIAQHMLPDEFTMAELRDTYEAMLEDFAVKSPSAARAKFDKSNFRARIKTMDMLKDTGRESDAKRPGPVASLFAFKHKDTRITVSL